MQEFWDELSIIEESCLWVFLGYHEFASPGGLTNPADADTQAYHVDGDTQAYPVDDDTQAYPAETLMKLECEIWLSLPIIVH